MKRFIIPLILMVASVLATVAAAITTTALNDREDDGGCYPVTRWEAPLDVDPYETTEFDESLMPEVEKSSVWKPNKEELILIGRLATGFAKWKSHGWWECGVLYETKEDIGDLALKYAFEIVRSVSIVSAGDDGETWKLNAWGLTGTMMNESRLDRCALGTHPRKRAYQLGLIKRRKRCISHTEEEILKAVTDKKMLRFFKKTGYDLGTGQLLSRFYPKDVSFKEMLSVRGGTLEAAWTMKRRGRWYKTDRPWTYWPGHKADWYDVKVTRWARKIGATKADI